MSEFDRGTMGGQGTGSSSGPSGNREWRSTTSTMEEATDEVTEKARELGDAVKEKTSEWTGKATEQVEAGKEKAASGLERTAEQLRAKAGSTTGVQQQAGMKVAGGMESAAGYLKEHSTEEILNDMEAYVRQHPTRALVGAIFAGFLIGRILR